MKKFIVGLLISLPLLAQSNIDRAPVRFVTTSPTGACNNGAAMRYNFTDNTFWGCENNVWTQTNTGGGGSGTVTSVGLVGTANQITVTGASPITSSGSWTLSIPSSPTLPGTTTGTFSGNLTGNVTGNASGTAGGLSTVLVESSGGTGANNTVGAAGHVLRSNATHYVDSAIQAGDLPAALSSSTSLNGVTTGTAVGDATAAQVIAHGATAMTTGALAGNTCASATTVGATGVATTDVILFTPNADISAAVGYGAGAAAGLKIYPFPTSGNVNFTVCNGTGTSITVPAMTLNWKVIR